MDENQHHAVLLIADHGLSVDVLKHPRLPEASMKIPPPSLQS